MSLRLSLKVYNVDIEFSRRDLTPSTTKVMPSGEKIMIKFLNTFYLLSPHHTTNTSPFNLSQICDITALKERFSLPKFNESMTRHGNSTIDCLI